MSVPDVVVICSLGRGHYREMLRILKYSVVTDERKEVCNETLTVKVCDRDVPHLEIIMLSSWREKENNFRGFLLVSLVFLWIIFALVRERHKISLSTPTRPTPSLLY